MTQSDAGRLPAVTNQYLLPGEVPGAGIFPDAEFLVGITAGRDGNIWVGEPDVAKIARITPSGVITEFGPLSVPPSTTSPGGPLEMGPGPDGNVWFSGGPTIGKITPAGVITEYPVPGMSPIVRGVAAGPDGNMWFADQSDNYIGRITTSGSSITTFTVPTANSAVGQITAGPDRNMWFTEPVANKIGRITMSGKITEFAIPSANSRPGGIVTGPDRQLWFCERDTSKIGRIRPSGVFTGEFSTPTAQALPSYITSGPDGSVWFTEFLANKIGRVFVSDGSIIEYSVPIIGNARGIAVGPERRDGGIDDGHMRRDDSPDLWFTIENSPPGGIVAKLATNSR